MVATTRLHGVEKNILSLNQAGVGNMGNTKGKIKGAILHMRQQASISRRQQSIALRFCSFQTPTSITS